MNLILLITKLTIKPTLKCIKQKNVQSFNKINKKKK